MLTSVTSFVIIFVTVLQNFCDYRTAVFFDPNSNFGTRIMLKLAKDKNPEIKSYRIALIAKLVHFVEKAFFPSATNIQA